MSKATIVWLAILSAVASAACGEVLGHPVIPPPDGGDPDGGLDFEWLTFYGSESADSINAATNDGDDGVRLAGYSYAGWNGPDGESALHDFEPSDAGVGDSFILSLGSDGTYRWHTFYGPDVEFFSIASDGYGRTYLVGISYVAWDGPGGESPLHAFQPDGSNTVILALDENGSYRWHTFFGCDSTVRGYSIAVAADGDTIITGDSSSDWDGPNGESPLYDFTESETPQNNAFVLALTQDGTYLWHAFFGTNGTNGFSVTASGDERLFVAGVSDFSSWNGPDGEAPLRAFETSADDLGPAFVLALNGDGTYLWHTFYNGMAVLMDSSIAADISGSTYVVGEASSSWNGSGGEAPLHAFSGTSFGTRDAVVLKLGADGAYRWHTFYGADSRVNGRSIKVDAEGTVLVAGDSDLSWSGPEGQDPIYAHSGDYDPFLLALDSDGGYLQHAFFGSGERDSHAGLAFDESGALYLSGSSVVWYGPDGEPPLHAHSGMRDAFVLKLTY